MRDIEQRLASPAPCMPRAQGQDPVVAQVPELLGPRLELRPIPLRVLDPLPHPFVAVVGGSLEDGHDRDPLDVGVEEVEELRQVGGPRCVCPVERLEGPPHDLHVLLRHRLLREPEGFEGLLVIAEQLDSDDLVLADCVEARSSLFDSGPWPASCQMNLRDPSPTSMKSLISSELSTSQVSRSWSTWP